MTLPQNIRVNVRANFPTLVQGGGFIYVSKSNGIWKIVPNFNNLSLLPDLSLAAQKNVVVQDSVTGVFNIVSLLSIIGGIINSNQRIITTSGQTLSTTDYIILVEASAPLSINLPANPPNGTNYRIKDSVGNADYFNITITPLSGTIDGDSNLVLDTPRQAAFMVWNATQNQWNLF